MVEMTIGGGKFGCSKKASKVRVRLSVTTGFRREGGLYVRIIEDGYVKSNISCHGNTAHPHSSYTSHVYEP